MNEIIYAVERTRCNPMSFSVAKHTEASLFSWYTAIALQTLDPRKAGEGTVETRDSTNLEAIKA